MVILPFQAKHMSERETESVLLIQLANTTELWTVCSLSWAEGAEPAAADSSDGLVPLQAEAFDFPTRRFGGGGKCSRASEEGWLQLQKWLQVWRRDEGFWNRRKAEDAWWTQGWRVMAAYVCLLSRVHIHHAAAQNWMTDTRWRPLPPERAQVWWTAPSLHCILIGVRLC